MNSVVSSQFLVLLFDPDLDGVGVGVRFLIALDLAVASLILAFSCFPSDLWGLCKELPWISALFLSTGSIISGFCAGVAKPGVASFTLKFPPVDSALDSMLFSDALFDLLLNVCLDFLAFLLIDVCVCSDFELQVPLRFPEPVLWLARLADLAETFWLSDSDILLALLRLLVVDFAVFMEQLLGDVFDGSSHVIFSLSELCSDASLPVPPTITIIKYLADLVSYTALRIFLDVKVVGHYSFDTIVGANSLWSRLELSSDLDAALSEQSYAITKRPSSSPHIRQPCFKMTSSPVSSSLIRIFLWLSAHTLHDCVFNTLLFRALKRKTDFYAISFQQINCIVNTAKESEFRDVPALKKLGLPAHEVVFNFFENKS